MRLRLLAKAILLVALESLCTAGATEASRLGAIEALANGTSYAEDMHIAANNLMQMINGGALSSDETLRAILIVDAANSVNHVTRGLMALGLIYLRVKHPDDRELVADTLAMVATESTQEFDREIGDFNIYTPAIDNPAVTKEATRISESVHKLRQLVDAVAGQFPRKSK